MFSTESRVLRPQKLSPRRRAPFGVEVALILIAAWFSIATSSPLPCLPKVSPPPGQTAVPLDTTVRIWGRTLRGDEPQVVPNIVYLREELTDELVPCTVRNFAENPGEPPTSGIELVPKKPLKKDTQYRAMGITFNDLDDRYITAADDPLFPIREFKFTTASVPRVTAVGHLFPAAGTGGGASSTDEGLTIDIRFSEAMKTPAIAEIQVAYAITPGTPPVDAEVVSVTAHPTDPQIIRVLTKSVPDTFTQVVVSVDETVMGIAGGTLDGDLDGVSGGHQVMASFQGLDVTLATDNPVLVQCQ